MSFRVTVSGLDRRPFQAFRWLEVAAQWADEVEPLAGGALRVAAPVGQGPGAGRLRDSITPDRAVSPSSVSMTFGTSVSYAGYVLDGTAPHLIRPRNARALRWTSGGATRFAQVVHHPGTKPNPFPEKAIRPLLSIIQDRLQEITATALRE